MSNNRHEHEDSQAISGHSFSQIPLVMQQDPEVTDFDLRIYALIWRYAWGARFSCTAHNETFARESRKGLTSVKKSLANLSRLGYISMKYKMVGTRAESREIFIEKLWDRSENNAGNDGEKNAGSATGSPERLGAGSPERPHNRFKINRLNNKRRGNPQPTIKKPTIHEAINLLSDIKPEYVRKAYEYWESVGWVRKNGYKVDHYIAAVRKSAEAEARFIASKQPSYEESKPLPKLPPRSE